MCSAVQNLVKLATFVEGLPLQFARYFYIFHVNVVLCPVLTWCGKLVKYSNPREGWTEVRSKTLFDKIGGVFGLEGEGTEQ